jgi:hypothetical protein
MSVSKRKYQQLWTLGNVAKFIRLLENQEYEGCKSHSRLKKFIRQPLEGSERIRIALIRRIKISWKFRFHRPTGGVDWERMAYGKLVACSRGVLVGNVLWPLRDRSRKLSSKREDKTDVR